MRTTCPSPRHLAGAALVGCSLLAGSVSAGPLEVAQAAVKTAAAPQPFPQPPRPRRRPPPEQVFVSGQSIIDNGGFEDGTNGWQLDQGHVRVTDRKAAHSGTACIMGAVTQPKQALFLNRKLPVRKGAVYRYDVWARAQKGVKMTVFIIQPGGDRTTRKGIGAHPNLPGKWKRFDGTFTAAATGELTLQFITPSSHGAAPGKVWVDDIAVTEFVMSEPISVTEGVGVNDEPSMASAADGSLYLSWLSFRDGADSLQLARYSHAADGFKRLGQWQVAGGAATYLFAPRLVDADTGAYLVYASEVDGNWDIYAVSCGPEGPGRPVRITSDPGVDTDPDGAWHNDTLWLAWESNRDGPRRVFATSVRHGKVAAPTVLSSARDSSYDPSIAVTENGQAAVAWHAFRQHNIDVYLRLRNTDDEWQAERRLTTAPGIDRHAVLFSRRNEFWIAYEHAQMKSYSIGGTQGRQLVTARIDPDGLKTPTATGRANPIDDKGEAPCPVFDEAGRLWMSFVRGNNRDWQVLLTAYLGGHWDRTSPITGLKGMDRTPCLAVTGQSAIIAFQADDMPGRYLKREDSLKAASDIYLVVRDLSGVGPVEAPALEPLVESDAAFEPAQLRVQYGEEQETPAIQYQGQTLKLFFGDLHDHTDVSICGRTRDESIDEAYQDMRDIVRHDFACVTDHGYNITPYLWAYTGKLARINSDPGRFLAFLGEEWTSTFEEYSEKHPYGFYGHRNLVFEDPYLSRWWNARNYQTPAEVWADLRKIKASFVQIPHQLADTGNVPVDWDYADEVAQPVAEIFQGRGSYEYLGAPRMPKNATPTKGYFIQDAWARGIVIGVIGSPDHTGGRGKACVYAPELTRKSVLAALRARHCYGTTAAKIVLDVRVNGALMGEKISCRAGQPVEVSITARCPGHIDRIEVCRSNEFIYTSTPPEREAELTFVDRDPLPGTSYYYVRVLQKDEEIAWTSPVWVTSQ